MRINKPGPKHAVRAREQGEGQGKAKPFDQAKYDESCEKLRSHMRRGYQVAKRSGRDKMSQADLRRTLADAGIDSKNLLPEEMKAIVDTLGASTNVLDEGAQKFTNTLRDAYYADMIDTANADYNRRAREQLAQDIKSFHEFVVDSHDRADKRDFDDFKKQLKEDRIETSEWQTMMLWLTTGAKQSQITS